MGLRRPGWVPAKNIWYGIGKILLLVLLAGVFPMYGILAAWVLPGILVLVPVSYLLVRQLIPQHRQISRSGQEMISARRVAGYTGGNYVGYLCTITYRFLPPLLVIHELGAAAAAYFYPPWLLASSVSLLTTNFSVALVVEGSFGRQDLALHTRRALRQTARLLLPMAAVLFIGAPYILRIFGADYAEEGTTLLRLLAVGLIPGFICVLVVRGCPGAGSCSCNHREPTRARRSRSGP